MNLGIVKGTVIQAHTAISPVIIPMYAVSRAVRLPARVFSMVSASAPSEAGRHSTTGKQRISRLVFYRYFRPSAAENPFICFIWSFVFKMII